MPYHTNIIVNFIQKEDVKVRDMFIAYKLQQKQTPQKKWPYFMIDVHLDQDQVVCSIFEDNQKLEKIRNELLAIPADKVSQEGYGIRLYILGHSSSGSDFLFAGVASKQGVKYDKISEFLYRKLFWQLPFHVLTLKNKIKISLIACSAGSPNAGPIAEDCINNSFAAKLLKDLYSKKVDCAIMARLSAVAVKQNEIDGRFEMYVENKKLNQRYMSRDNAAKVIYYYNHGHQVIGKSYSHSEKDLREDALDTINDCIETTESEIKKQGLCRLLNAIFTLPDTLDIFMLINKELISGRAGRGYHVHTHNDVWGFGKTRTYKALYELLQRHSGKLH